MKSYPWLYIPCEGRATFVKFEGILGVKLTLDGVKLTPLEAKLNTTKGVVLSKKPLTRLGELSEGIVDSGQVCLMSFICRVKNYLVAEPLTVP